MVLGQICDEDLKSDVTRRDLGDTRRGMVVNGRPMKRLKRRVTADLNDFLTFPDDGSIAGSGPFRTTVKEFLSKHALLPPPSSLFPHLLTWQILFRVGNLTDGDGDSSPSVVCLDVIEEDVARCRSVYCDQCRVVGEFPIDKLNLFILNLDDEFAGLPLTLMDSLELNRRFHEIRTVQLSLRLSIRKILVY